MPGRQAQLLALAEEGDDFTASLLSSAQAFNEFDLVATSAQYQMFTDTLEEAP